MARIITFIDMFGISSSAKLYVRDLRYYSWAVSGGSLGLLLYCIYSPIYKKKSLAAWGAPLGAQP